MRVSQIPPVNTTPDPLGLAPQHTLAGPPAPRRSDVFCTRLLHALSDGFMLSVLVSLLSNIAMLVWVLASGDYSGVAALDLFHIDLTVDMASALCWGGLLGGLGSLLVGLLSALICTLRLWPFAPATRWAWLLPGAVYAAAASTLLAQALLGAPLFLVDLGALDQFRVRTLAFLLLSIAQRRAAAPLARRAAAPDRPAPRMRVLDLMCDSGLLWPGILRAIGPSGSLVALDSRSSAELAASQRAQRLGRAADIRLIRSSVLASGLPDRSVDVVACAFGLAEVGLAEHERLVAELDRVLVPGGLVAVVERTEPPAGAARRLARRYPAGLPALRQLLESYGFFVSTTVLVGGAATILLAMNMQPDDAG